jgi:hypothetical protein
MSTESHDARPACTCPSGDGSLQWPCPAHPPTQKQVAVEFVDHATLQKMWSDYINRCSVNDPPDRRHAYVTGVQHGAKLRAASTAAPFMPPGFTVDEISTACGIVGVLNEAEQQSVFDCLRGLRSAQGQASNPVA